MTDEQIGNFIQERLGECLSSFIIVGFRSDNHVPLVFSNLPDPQCALAVNAVMCNVLGQGGFPCDAQKDA